MVKCADRLATVEIILPLPAFGQFKLEPGMYAFEVVCEGEVIGSHRLTVKFREGVTGDG